MSEDFADVAKDFFRAPLPKTIRDVPPEEIAIEFPTLAEYFEYSGVLSGEPRIVMPFHKAILNAMMDLILGRLPGKKKKLAICMPPGHGKTF